MRGVLRRRALVGSLVALALTAATAGTGLLSPWASAHDAAVQLVAPRHVEVGELFHIDVVAHDVDDLAGFELLAQVDSAAAALDGAGAAAAGLGRDGRTFRDMSIGDLDGRAVLAAYSCGASCGADPSGVDGTVPLGTVMVRANRPGRLEIRLGNARIVDSHGEPIDVGGSEWVVGVDIGAGGAPMTAPPPPVPATTLSSASGPDDSGSAVASPTAEPRSRDLTSAELEWRRHQITGDSCGTPSLDDLDGDGCLAIADLQLLAVRTTQTKAVPASTPGGTSSSLAAPTSSPFVVDTDSDEWDSNAGNGICRTQLGTCSLRAAMQEADARPGADTINFAIPGEGVHTIQLLRRLPNLTDTSGGVMIDGYTQPGTTPNTDLTASNAVIKIAIRGNGGDDFDAFTVTSGGNTFRGLAVYAARRPFWIYGSAAAGNRIVGSFVGTDPGATYVSPGLGDAAHGINVEQDAPATVIGGATPGDRNVISGNARHGIGLWHNGSDHAVVQGNIIGLSPDGIRRVPNRKHGVDMNFGVSDTLVGGTNPAERNVISGNDDSGVEVSHTNLTRDNRILGNFIGTDLTGAGSAAYTAHPNTGVFIEDGATDNVVDGNVIVNNQKGGVQVANGGVNGVSAGNIIRANRVGVTIDDTPAPNGIVGIAIEGSDTLVADNLVVGNLGPGIKSTELDAQRNRFTRNAISGNSGLGIDLAPLNVVNANDPGDGDSGPNGLLNFPVITRATDQVFQGTACSGCLVELFRATGASGNGSGVEFVTDVTANGGGGFSVANTALPIGASVTATAADPTGATSEFSANSTVVEHNDPPEIDAGAPATVPEGGNVGLTATGSDPDGDAFSYAWDLDGDESFETSGASVTFSAAALDGPATQTVTVQATDVRGATSTDAVDVTITNVAPTATLSVPSSIVEASSASVQLTDRTDPSAADLAAGLRYAFSCTGASLAGATWATASDVPATTCSFDDGPASLNIRARIIDRDGGATEYVAALDISNVVPTVTISGAPTAVAEGDTISLSSTATDPSLADTSAGFTRSWTAVRSGSTVATGSGSSFAVETGDDGTHTLSLSVTDKDDGVGTASVDVAVSNVAPTATLVTAADAATATLTLESPVDPSAADVAAGLHYALSCSGASLASTTYDSASTSNTTTCSYSDGLSSRVVRARILDKDGGFSDYSTSVSHGSNQPPVVTTTSSTSVDEGDATTLTATGSDPENGPLVYEWDLDDDGTFETSGQTVTFSAASVDGPIGRLVHVRATDAADLTATADSVVHVVNVAPTGIFANSSGSEGAPITISVASATDPSAADASSLRFAFACDGASLGAVTYAAAQPSATTTCTYPDGPTTTSVRAKVLDDDGGATEYTATVTVANTPPSVTIDPLPPGLTEGASVPFSGVVSDPSPADTAAGLGVTWRVTIGAATVASGGGSSGSFTPLDEGSYVVSFVATDKDGGSTTRTVTAAVAGVAPVAELSAPASATEGSTVAVALADAADPSPADTLAGLHYAFACDGSPLTAATYASSGTAASTSCVFPEGPATTTVRARVIDKDGLFTERSASVSVTNVAPTARLTVPSDVLAGDAVSLVFDDPRDPSTDDVTAGLSYSFNCGGGFGPFGPSSTATCPGAPPLVHGQVRDADGDTTTYAATVLVHPNQLANASFETDANGDGAPDSWPWSTKLTWSTSARTGARSVSQTSTNATTVTLSQTISGLARSRYLASVWALVPSGPGSTSVTLRIKWLDAGGAVLSSKSAPAFTDRTTGWVPLTVGGMAADNAVAARVEIVTTTSGGSTVRLDDVGFRFDNQLLNPGLEDDTNNDGRPDVWASVSRFTRSPVEVHGGAVSGRALGDGATFTASQRVTKIVTGATYRSSAWFNMPSTTDAYTLRYRLRWLDSQQHLIRLDTLAQANTATPGWIQITGTAVAPAGAAEVRVELNFAGLETAAYVDDVFLGPV